MLFNKAVIGLFIFTLSLSWIQAISVEKKEKELSLPEDVSRLVTQNSTSELTSADNSASKSINFTDDNSLSKEDSITDYDFGEESSNIEDYLPKEGSGSSIDAFGDDSDDKDGSYPEKHYDNEDNSSADNEFDASAEDDDLDVTSLLPVTTTKDFIFEEPASTTLTNEDATEKAASADQAIPWTIIIVMSIFAVILLIILLTLLKIYCVPRKATQEENSTDQTSITVDKFMTTENET